MKVQKVNRSKLSRVAQGLTLGLIFLSIARAASEGTGRGGGDNPTLESDAAWFTGEQTIRYCLDVSKDFGVDQETLKSEVENAFSHWTRYIEKKEVNPPRGPLRAIRLKRKLLDFCNGQENLKFYFGTTSPEVDAAKRKFDNPTAFTQRTASQPPRGFVWFVSSRGIDPGKFVPEQAYPNWQTPHLLEGFLLHEIGHIAGNGHVTGTIMDDIELRMQARGFWNNGSHVIGVEHLTHIDQYVELYSCEHCPIRGTLSSDPTQANAAFELFTGRKPVGKVYAKLVYRPNQREDLAPKLTLYDQTGPAQVTIQWDMNLPGAWTAIEIWQTVFKVASDQPLIEVDDQGREITLGQLPDSSIGRHLEAGSAYSIIVAASGRKFPMRMDFNVRTSNHDSPIQLRYFSNGAWLDLFQMEVEE